MGIQCSVRMLHNASLPVESRVFSKFMNDWRSADCIPIFLQYLSNAEYKNNDNNN
jgi:hypothetical protein